jgi:hypothetical protein
MTPDPMLQPVFRLLSDITPFSNLILQRPLRPYQVEPLHAILDSVLFRRGLEFLLIFPRQSGKNEAVAQLLVYLLNVYQRHGGNVVYGATASGIGLGIQRLEQRLENSWNTGLWRIRAKPDRRILGRASVVFLSSHPNAFARGQTAHHLLVVDETQDQVASHVEAVFTPMRAAHNATAVYIGTVRTTSDFLWQKKLELERDQDRDGLRRVFLVDPAQVTAENPAYGQFLKAQVRRYGRHHPIVASEYFLEPLDGTGGLFDARRRALMRGDHARQHQPETGRLYVATLDLAGQDEAATDPIAQLARPGRDYTVATIFKVTYPPPGAYAPGPTYQALDVLVDHGSRHFEDHPGRPALVQRLLAWLQHWQIAHLVADASGVGQGVVSWLATALGPRTVTGYDFAGPGKKAALGSLFLSLVETGRFKYWGNDAGEVGSDGWWFWRQVEACAYEVPPEGRFDRDLRWEVPPTHRTDTPAGPQPTHDDRLLSAALIAELDRLLRGGHIILGTAESAVIQPRDPLEDLHHYPQGACSERTEGACPERSERSR